MNPYGTAHQGEQHYRHKLTDRDVARMRDAARCGTLNASAEARRKRVTAVCIIRAVKGFTWKHLPKPCRRNRSGDR
jgi:hypothetical protein